MMVARLLPRQFLDNEIMVFKLGYPAILEHDQLRAGRAV